MSKFINDFIVGIDVASEFSYVVILAPNGDLIRKPFKIDHNNGQPVVEVNKRIIMPLARFIESLATQQV